MVHYTQFSTSFYCTWLVNQTITFLRHSHTALTNEQVSKTKNNLKQHYLLIATDNLTCASISAAVILYS